MFNTDDRLWQNFCELTKTKSVAGVCVIVLGICFCCIRRCCRKRRAKGDKKGMKGVDLKSVQLLGSAYKEKV